MSKPLILMGSPTVVKSTSDIKAVLVRLSIRIFPNTRQDPEITDEVRLKKSLGIGAGKWVKSLLPEASMKSLREIGGEFRRRHYDLTLPWEEGYRLLPSTAHKGYESEREEYAKTFNQAVRDFGTKYRDSYKLPANDEEAKAYFAMLVDLKQMSAKDVIHKGEVKLPSLVDQAKIMHNGTFNASLYPEWTRMEKHFDFGAEFSPVPKAAHFITSGFAASAVAEMKSDLEKHNEQRVAAAVQDTWVRLMTPIKNLADKLSSKETIFRDSLIGNVREITALVPKLNLTGDKTLAKVAEEIESRFAKLDPELLRTDAALRKDVASAAKSLVAKFGQVGKRRFA